MNGMFYLNWTSTSAFICPKSDISRTYSANTPIGHNIKITCFTFCKFLLCCQNSSDRHGMGTEQMLDQIGIWGPDRLVWPFVMLLGSFLSSFCGVAEQIFLLGRPLREYHWCLDGCCVSNGTYTNAKTQVFPC